MDPVEPGATEGVGVAAPVQLQSAFTFLICSVLPPTFLKMNVRVTSSPWCITPRSATSVSNRMRGALDDAEDDSLAGLLTDAPWGGVLTGLRTGVDRACEPSATVAGSAKRAGGFPPIGLEAMVGVGSPLPLLVTGELPDAGEGSAAAAVAGAGEAGFGGVCT
jgi:hypothetical protein